MDCFLKDYSLSGMAGYNQGRFAGVPARMAY